MFSARLGFMRPDSVTEPDEPVLPPDDPSVAGNMWFSTRQNDDWNRGDTRRDNNPYNNLVTDNWMMFSIVLPAWGTTQGFVTINGLNVDASTNKPSNPQQLPNDQPVFDKFCLGAFVNNNLYGETKGNQMGTPMYVRDFYIHNGVTSLSDVQKIEGWMCHEAGLENILQSEHPYKSSAPGGFTPSDLSPRAWWHAPQNFDPAGTATWSTMDGAAPAGAHTLTKGTVASGQSETIQEVTEDGITAIKFPNSKTNKNNPSSGFTGAKYIADSVAIGSNIDTLGVTICALFKIYDMPNVYDQDTIPYANTSWFTLNTSKANSYFNGGFRPETNTTTQFTSDDSDTFDDSGNADVNPANVTTDGGNVSV